MNAEKPEKTFVGVLASHDDPKLNQELVHLFNWLCNTDPHKLRKFHFIFTGGTYDRIIQGDDEIKPISEASIGVLKKCGVTRLPSRNKGGVSMLSYFVSQRLCSILWAFWAPYQNHWLRPENLALMRLCDQWHVKRLLNSRSVQIWFDYEAPYDGDRNLVNCPPTLVFREETDWKWEHPFEGETLQRQKKGTSVPFERPKEKLFKEMTIALIAHDEMKGRMIEFAIDHESELRKFGSIITTATTGREVAAATTRVIDKKIFRYHSGPKGGDIEIATEIVNGHCDIVVFFVDPLHPHPHREDILVVFEACMISPPDGKPQVLMITNEMHAREFMTRVVRGRDKI